MNYAKVNAINYDKNAAHKDSVKSRKTIPNPDAQLYLALKRKGKLKTINVIPLIKWRDETYKEWIERNDTKTL